MTAVTAAGRPDRWNEVRKHRHFYLFVSPFFMLFAVFGLYSLLFSLYLSFVTWDGMTDQVWVGLGNFNTMLSDELLQRSLWNTLVIGLLYVPPMMILAFAFAQILNLQWLKARAFFRAAFFLPCVTPMVVIAIVFGLGFATVLTLIVTPAALMAIENLRQWRLRSSERWRGRRLGWREA